VRKDVQTRTGLFSRNTQVNPMAIPTKDFKTKVESELQNNILPFWIEHMQDKENGGFYGALTNDLQIHNQTPRSAVLCARILWTYAAASRLFGKPEQREMAQRAYDYLTNVFLDKIYGGVYWSVDYQGNVVEECKHSYAQAFAIYGLAEYYKTTCELKSLQLARKLFEQLDAHAHDSIYGGYIEGCRRDWGALADMRLSDKEINCRKSMNTTLHILEAYTDLTFIWNYYVLQARLKELIEICLEHVIDPQTHHFRLFFDDNWTSLKNDIVSYGHDIEGSWLLVEAAKRLGDADLIQKTRSNAVLMAQAVYEEGLDADGSIFYEGGPSQVGNSDKHWWVQAEGVVGFYNAFQISGQAHFAQASQRCWETIEDKFVDRENGEWFKVLERGGTPYPGQYKAGPWECPYHHSRACFEMSARLSG
jgi:mannobiose 2-epimerase